MVNFPYPVIREGYEDQKVVNFDVSENMSIFQLDNGQIWWCGGHISYKPERATFEEEDNIRLFAASGKSFIIVSNSNNVHSCFIFRFMLMENSLIPEQPKEMRI